MAFCYGSLCSGIEAATVAWKPLGWEPAWFSEIEPFCCALLKDHYPDVENLGDATRIKRVPPVDVIVGGTPCQSFSVNGARAGIADARGNVTASFFEVLGRSRARWFVWENVENILRIDGGDTFAKILGAVFNLGYRCAWKVLDLRGFGIPQRRRRLFLVGHFRNWRYPAAVLLHRLPGRPHCREDRETQIIGWSGDETPKGAFGCVPTLRSSQGGEGVGVAYDGIIRRLTPREWERMMGFPDGYTEFTYKGKPASDKARFAAIGNSFPVPILHWIGERIHALETR